MAKGENRMIRRRLFNAYVSSIVSISLVLLLVGVATLLLVNSRAVADYFKENMQLSVLMKQDVDETAAAAYGKSVGTLPYVRDTRLVSREEGTEELKKMLGDDFLSVFETSPVPVSLEVSLHAAYVSADSLAKIIPVLSASPLVEEVDCQKSLVDALNSNLAKISLILGVFIFLLLFISFVLINGTVRLNVFARRFTVHTMKLVGATRSFIRRPFVIRSVWQGLCSAVLALLMLAMLLYLLGRSFVQFSDMFALRSLLLVAAVVLLCGVLICMTSTYFVVNKLVALDKDDLYY